MFAQHPVWGNVYPVSASMTGDDLLLLPEDGSKNELYEGVLIKETMTSIGHGMISQRLGGVLFVYAQNTNFPNTIVQNTLFDLTPSGVSRRTVLAPDLAILRGKVAPALNVTTAVPLIAVEVVSPSQTLAELAIKAQFYRNAEVAEVWLIDPATRVIELWNDQARAVLIDSQSLTTTLLPGFSIAIATLLDG